MNHAISSIFVTLLLVNGYFCFNCEQVSSGLNSFNIPKVTDFDESIVDGTEVPMNPCVMANITYKNNEHATYKGTLDNFNSLLTKLDYSNNLGNLNGLCVKNMFLTFDHDTDHYFTVDYCTCTRSNCTSISVPITTCQQTHKGMEFANVTDLYNGQATCILGDECSTVHGVLGDAANTSLIFRGCVTELNMLVGQLFPPKTTIPAHQNCTTSHMAISATETIPFQLCVCHGSGCNTEDSSRISCARQVKGFSNSGISDADQTVFSNYYGSPCLTVKGLGSNAGYLYKGSINEFSSIFDINSHLSLPESDCINRTLNFNNISKPLELQYCVCKKDNCNVVNSSMSKSTAFVSVVSFCLMLVTFLTN